MTTNPLPLDPLSAVADRFGDVLLLGAHARDHVVNVLAGLAPARRTHDLDLAVAVPDVERYRELTATLRPTSDTGMRFAIAGVPVDLIPFHPDGELGPVVEVTAGVQMDLTGIDEAFRTSEPSPDDARLRLPTLQAMVVLKTVAWRMRGGTTGKDATDLGLLLQCLDQGAYADRWLDAPDAMLDRYDFDARLISGHELGRAAARDLPRASRVVTETWREPALAAAISVGTFERTRVAATLRAIADGGAAAAR